MADSVSINEVDGQVSGGVTLDFDSIFSGDSTPLGQDDVVFECDRPHWSVSREEMKKVLQVIGSFPARATIFLALWKEGSKLHIHANNRDAFIDSQLPILNEDPYDSLRRVYFVESDKLLAFVQSYKQFVFSFDEKGAIYYQSPYALYKLDTVAIALDEVRIKPEPVEKWIRFPLTKAEIGVLKALYGFAVKISDSKVLLKGSSAEAFFTLYKYTIDGVTGTSESVIVRRLDLPTIYEISDGDLSFAFTKDRVYFQFSLGVVSFLRVPYDEESFMYPATFADGAGIGDFRLDVPLIRQALKLTTFLNVDVVEFKSEGQDIFMVASERVKFKVGAGALSQPFLINIDLFTRILNTVDVGELYIDAHVTEHGIDLILKRDTVVTYSLARTSVAQFKKDEKAEMRLGVREEQVKKMQDAGVLPDQVTLPGNKTLAEVFQDGDIF